VRHRSGECGVFLSWTCLSFAATSAVSAGLGAGGGFLVLCGGLWVDTDGQEVEVGDLFPCRSGLLSARDEVKELNIEPAGAKARIRLAGLHGAEAPLFHGAACILTVLRAFCRTRRSSTVAHAFAVVPVSG